SGHPRSPRGGWWLWRWCRCSSWLLPFGVRGPRWVRPPRDGWRSGGEGGEVIGEHREAAGGLIDDPLGLCADAGGAEDDGEVDVAGDRDDGCGAEAVALRQGAHEASGGGGGGVVVRHGSSVSARLQCRQARSCTNFLCRAATVYGSRRLCSRSTSDR